MTEQSQISPNIGTDDHAMNPTLDDSLDHHSSPPSSSSSSNDTRLIHDRDVEGPSLTWSPSGEDRQDDDNDVGPDSRQGALSSINNVTTVNPVDIINETSTNRVSTRRRTRGGKKSSRQFEHSQTRDAREQPAKISLSRGVLEHSEVPLLPTPHFLGASNPVRQSQNLNEAPFQSTPAYSPPSSSATSSSSSSSRYHPYASHSRTASGATQPRSSSPSGSVISIVTSHSNATSHVSLPTNILKTHRKQRKQKLTDDQRREICIFAEKNPTMRQEDIATKWFIERSTVSKILKDKKKWVMDPPAPLFLQTKIVKHRPSKFPEIEWEMMDWLKHCDDNKINITDAMIRDKGKEIALQKNIGEDKFKASAGWVENFKHRKGLRRGKWVFREDFLRTRPIVSLGKGYEGSSDSEDDERARNYNPENYYDRSFGDYDPETGIVDIRRPRIEEDVELDTYEEPRWSGAQNDDRNASTYTTVYNHDQDQSQSAPVEDAMQRQHPGQTPMEIADDEGHFDEDGVWRAKPYDPSDVPGSVTAQMAEGGLDLVIKFVKQQGADYLDADEVEVLQYFKSILYNASMGIAPPKRKPRA